jgi:hypothetical protein
MVRQSTMVEGHGGPWSHFMRTRKKGVTGRSQGEDLPFKGVIHFLQLGSTFHSQFKFWIPQWIKPSIRSEPFMI